MIGAPRYPGWERGASVYLERDAGAAPMLQSLTSDSWRDAQWRARRGVRWSESGFPTRTLTPAMAR